MCGLYTDKLESGLHCQKAVASANRILGMMRRAFNSMSRNLFVSLCKTYVRPHSEYCVQLWCPYLAKDIEKVQVCATKASVYNQTVKIRTLFIVYCRCVQGDLIETS